jgi:hypothetical protein
VATPLQSVFVEHVAGRAARLAVIAMHVTPDDEWVSRGTAPQLLLESFSTSPPARLAPGEARVVDELHALWTASDRALADAANYYIYEALPGGPPDPASLAHAPRSRAPSRCCAGSRTSQWTVR